MFASQNNHSSTLALLYSSSDWQISFSLFFYLPVCLFIYVSVYCANLKGYHRLMRFMRFMAISRHACKLYLTFSCLASILIQKTMSQCRKDKVFSVSELQNASFSCSLTSFLSPFSSNMTLLWTPSLLPSVSSVTAVQSSVFLLSVFFICILIKVFSSNCSQFYINLA